MDAATDSPTLPPVTLICGDALEASKALAESSIDALVTDPPAGIGFMSATWDDYAGYTPRSEVGRSLDAALRSVVICDRQVFEDWAIGFAAFTADWGTAAIRVLKPGAHGFVWALPRTAYLTALGLQAAGFELRDSLEHIFGSGFPKSLNISKAIDAALGADRPVVGMREQRNPYAGGDGITWQDAPDYAGQAQVITAPATPEAAEYQGHHTALRPGREDWILVRKPLDTISHAELHVLTSRDWWCERDEIKDADKVKAIAAEHKVKPLLREPPPPPPKPQKQVEQVRLDLPAAKQKAPKPTPYFIKESRKAMHPGVDNVVVLYHAGGELEVERTPFKPWTTNAVVANVLKWGTGTLNVDAGRLNTPEVLSGGAGRLWSHYRDDAEDQAQAAPANTAGRWPQNVCFSHHPDCQMVGTKRVRNPSGSVNGNEPSAKTSGVLGTFAERSPFQRHADPDGMETVEDWQCVPGCPVAELDRQGGPRTSGARRKGVRTGMGYGGAAGDGGPAVAANEGGPSRYFPIFAWTEDDFWPFLYAAKPSPAEKEAGCERLPTRKQDDSREEGAPGGDNPRNRGAKGRHNFQPTVKGIQFIRHLVRLVSRPGGKTIDFFVGSGTTLIACLEEGVESIGYELEPAFHAIARARVEYHRRRLEHTGRQPTMF